MKKALDRSDVLHRALKSSEKDFQIEQDQEVLGKPDNVYKYDYCVQQ